MLRPVQTVRVTTKEELDAALATADEITVEGDDELLSYAVNRAAGDPEIIEVKRGDTYNISGQAGVLGPGGHSHDNTFQQIQSGIDLPTLAKELGHLRAAMKGETAGTREQDKAIGSVADAEEAAAKGDGTAALRYLKSAGAWALRIAEKIGVAVAIEALAEAAGLTQEKHKAEEGAARFLLNGKITPPAPSAIGPRYGTIAVTAALFTAVVLVIGAAIWLFAGRSAPPSSYPGIGTGGGGPTGESEFWTNLPSLLWPGVAIVAIIALFLIARQAISSGRNVTIVWKVTEKVTGRVVITKVREREPRSAKAA